MMENADQFDDIEPGRVLVPGTYRIASFASENVAGVVRNALGKLQNRVGLLIQIIRRRDGFDSPEKVRDSLICSVTNLLQAMAMDVVEAIPIVYTGQDGKEHLERRTDDERSRAFMGKDNPLIIAGRQLDLRGVNYFRLDEAILLKLLNCGYGVRTRLVVHSKIAEIMFRDDFVVRMGDDCIEVLYVGEWVPYEKFLENVRGVHMCLMVDFRE